MSVDHPGRLIELAGAPGPIDDRGRPVVAVQGLGFVGAAMAVAVASARDVAGRSRFTVIGVERDDEQGRDVVESLNSGALPFRADDPDLVSALVAARRDGDLFCCWDESAYEVADVVVIDVPFDVDWTEEPPAPRYEPFLDAVESVARRVRPGALVLVETTVPPGTTERMVVPLVSDVAERRGIDPDDVLVAHSYERVMPGPGYLSSITSFWRVYAGRDERSADAAEAFLSAVVDTESYPLRRLGSTTASETAKVLENTYRATTIALMDEWSRFAEAAGVDLFEVVDAIRDRPTHSNVRTPGLGVGGYCLTKDPLFGAMAAASVLELDVSFPVSEAAVRINRDSPRAAVDMARTLLGGSLSGARVLLCGASYRPGVDDTRSSPSEPLLDGLLSGGAEVTVHDPLVRRWAEAGLDCRHELPDVDDVDLVVFAVAHDEYRSVDLERWFGASRPAVLDAFGVLDPSQRETLRRIGCASAAIGRPFPDAPGQEPVPDVGPTT